MVTKPLDIGECFRLDAEALVTARRSGQQVHRAGDIRASGNELEVPVRQWLRRMLPARYVVEHGHVIDSTGATSPQLDVIIADSTYASSILKTADGTTFVPIESVFVVGEVKSTYYKASQPIQSFSKTIETLRDMKKEEIVNTVYGGITPESDLLQTRYINEQTVRLALARAPMPSCVHEEVVPYQRCA